MFLNIATGMKSTTAASLSASASSVRDSEYIGHGGERKSFS